MQREFKLTVPRSWFLASVSTVAVVALVVGLWVGMNLSSPGQTSVVAASYDSGSLASTHSAADGYVKAGGAACSGIYED